MEGGVGRAGLLQGVGEISSTNKQRSSRVPGDLTQMLPKVGRSSVWSMKICRGVPLSGDGPISRPMCLSSLGRVCVGLEDGR